MKSIVITIVFMISLTSICYASNPHIPTTVTNTTNEYTSTDRQEWGYGIGADVVVYKSSNPLFSEVTIEPRYDIENRETRVFGIVRVDLFEALKGGK